MFFAQKQHTCGMCGMKTAAHNRDVRFRLPPDDLQHAYRVWNAPEYSDLKLTGYLANRIKPWNLFAASVNLAVLDPEQTPYCVSSDNEELNDVLTKEWPHDILASLP